MLAGSVMGVPGPEPASMDDEPWKIHAGRFRHGGARSGRDDAAALHLPALERGGGQVEADVGALLPLFRGDEDAVAHDDQALGGFGAFVRHGKQYTTFALRRASRPWPLGGTACGPPRTSQNGDADHAGCLTGGNAALLMR